MLPQNDEEDAVAGERTALLQPSQRDRKGKGKAEEQTKLPWLQLSCILVLRFGEPLSSTTPWPFMAKMIDQLHIVDDPRDIGFVQGSLETCFYLATFCSVLQLGSLSDRVGRRPVILATMGGLSVAIVAFGASKSFAAMMVTRCLMGVANGNVAATNSVVGEITDATNVGRAFSLMPIPWSIGSLLGPLIGGYLSEPAKRFPTVFGKIPLFVDFPYLLPTLVSGAIPALGTVMAFLFLKESLAPASKVNSTASEEDDGPPPSLSHLMSKRIFVILLNFAVLAVQVTALQGLMVLTCYTSVEYGGLGFNEQQIGIVLSSISVLAGLLQVFAYPALSAHLGTVGLYRLSMGMYPVAFLALPVASYVAAAYPEDQNLLRGVLLLVIVARAVGNMVFAGNMAILTLAAPSRRLLGRLNGVAAMTAAGFGASGPAIGSSLFAISKRHPGILGGQLVFFVFALFATASLGAAFLIPTEGALAVTEMEDVDNEVLVSRGKDKLVAVELELAS